MLMLCFGMIFLGAFIMIFSIYRYCKVLAVIKIQNYQNNVFKSWVYKASFLMMCFFLIGYIVVGVSFLNNVYQPYYFLIALIFMFGAIFVICMIIVQELMSETIIRQVSETIQSMVRVMEAKDIYTHGHSEHVCRLVQLLWLHLPQEQKQTINIGKLTDAALLHDIGKIGIPDSILNKPGKLTEQEMDVIRQHPLKGKEILENTCYRDISEWILYHHERIDGTGYYQLPGERIPLESKMIALADVFSALYTDRVYRPRFTFGRSIEIIEEVAGTQLDENLVSILLKIDRAEIEAVSEHPILVYSATPEND